MKAPQPRRRPDSVRSAQQVWGVGPVPTPHKRRAQTWAISLLQFALAAIVFRLAGSLRPFMDADEGHFLSSIRCVYEGMAPCRDFFFQQTPLFPYPYAAAMKVFGYGYETCVWTSILFAAGLAVVTGTYFADRSGRLATSWVGWLLIVLNANILFWAPTIKNHSMPLFFGALGIWAAARRPESRRGAFWWGALAGFAGLCCVGSRVLALPLSVAAALWIALRAIARSRPPGAAYGMLGYLAGMMPPAVLILRSVFPDARVFYFDVLGFHAIRSGTHDTWGTWETVTRRIFAMVAHFQFPVILALALIAAAAAIVHVAGVIHRRPVSATCVAADATPAPPGLLEGLLALAGLGGIVLALLLYQTYTQYFMVPFVLFLFASVPIWSWLARARPATVWRSIGLVLLAAYAGVLTFPRAKTTEGVPPAETKRPEWTLNPAALMRRLCAAGQEEQFDSSWSLKTVRKISDALRATTGPDDVVFSTWQGYTFLADRRDLPGNENFNSHTVTNLPAAVELKPDELARLRIASNAELLSALLQAKPKAIVIGICCPGYMRILGVLDSSPGNAESYVGDAQTGWFMLRPDIQKNYHLVKQIRGPTTLYYHQLWVRNPAT